jgi:hypothetical protein
MLTRILHNSFKLCTFLDQLNIDMSKPQHRHILNMADALLVCEDTKTLAALQRQFIEAPDASNMADFLRISPWQADDVRTVRLTPLSRPRIDQNKVKKEHQQSTQAKCTSAGVR